MSVHEMTAAMYYLLAQRRGERGAEPNGEHMAHKDCTPISDDELSFLRRSVRAQQRGGWSTDFFVQQYVILTSYHQHQFISRGYCG